MVIPIKELLELANWRAVPGDMTKISEEATYSMRCRPESLVVVDGQSTTSGRFALGCSTREVLVLQVENRARVTAVEQCLQAVRRFDPELALHTTR